MQKKVNLKAKCDVRWLIWAKVDKKNKTLSLGKFQWGQYLSHMTDQSCEQLLPAKLNKKKNNFYFFPGDFLCFHFTLGRFIFFFPHMCTDGLIRTLQTWAKTSRFVTSASPRHAHEQGKWCFHECTKSNRKRHNQQKENAVISSHWKLCG